VRSLSIFGHVIKVYFVAMEETRAAELKYVFKIIFLSFNSQEKFIRKSRMVLGGLRVSLSLRFYGDSQKPCTCSSSTVTKYQKRISGPLLDRKAPWFIGCRHPY
jgi:hypothetical protein